MKREATGIVLALGATFVVALAVTPSPAIAFHEATIHIEGGAWFPTLDAEVRSSGAG